MANRLTMDPTPRDYTAYALSRQIMSLTRAYMREVEEFIRQRDMRGAHACEERFEEEILEACQTANSAQHDVIKRMREELASILAVPLSVQVRPVPEQIRCQSVRPLGQQCVLIVGHTGPHMEGNEVW